MVLMVSACGNSSATDLVIMQEMIDDPLVGSSNPELMRKSFGADGVVVQYKRCMTGISQDTYEEFKEGLKQKTKKMSDTKSIALVDECPASYDALCKDKMYAKYYYTKSKRILDHVKEECAFFGGSAVFNTQGKEEVVKKEKATLIVDGKTYNFEALQNCMVNPMIPGIVSVPQLKSGTQWMTLDASTRGDNMCKISFGKIGGVTYHGEGKKCHSLYDGKRIKGKATARRIGRKKGKEVVEVSFDIECE